MRLIACILVEQVAEYLLSQELGFRSATYSVDGRRPSSTKGSSRAQCYHFRLAEDRPAMTKTPRDNQRDLHACGMSPCHLGRGLWLNLLSHGEFHPHSTQVVCR